MRSHLFQGPVFRMAIPFIFVFSAIGTTCGHALNLEGQCGGIITPFAYTVESKPNSVSFPAAAFHLLSGGDVIGIHYQTSLTMGLFGRAEVGYSRSSVTEGSSEPFCNLFDRGFNMNLPSPGQENLIHFCVSGQL